MPTMRTTPPLKLYKSPLILVLAQIRFSPVLLIKDFIPVIQEELRKQKYSDYRAEQIQQVMFTGTDVKTEQTNRWVFASRDRRHAVIIAPDFVIYETSNYDVFETFLERFRPVLDLVQNKVGPDFAKQVGLRYVDLIRPTQTRTASEFLCEGLRGLPKEKLNVPSAFQQFTAQTPTPYGELNIRSLEGSYETILPPDLASSHIELALPSDPSEVCRTLDIDHISQSEVDFAPSALLDRLWDLHGPAADAFLAATTPEAIAFWKEEL